MSYFNPCLKPRYKDHHKSIFPFSHLLDIYAPMMRFSLLHKAISNNMSLHLLIFPFLLHHHTPLLMHHHPLTFPHLIMTLPPHHPLTFLHLIMILLHHLFTNPSPSSYGTNASNNEEGSEEKGKEKHEIIADASLKASKT